MNSEDEDSFGFSDWPEEFLVPGDFGESELWSQIFVQHGLMNADLRPLAEHLRKGYALPPSLAAMIADGIEESGHTPYRIFAKRQKGRPAGKARSRTNKNDALTHTEKLDIGIAAEKALRDTKRPHMQVVMRKLCDKFGVSITTVKNARNYVKEWIGPPEGDT